jgi:DNA-3-methyladenine glycosylase II
MHYVQHLQKDEKLAILINEPYHEIKLRKNITLHLIASIMSQQLSTKVADVIYKRFLQLYNGEEPTPQQVLATDATVLRSIGLSNAKVSYVHNVARFVAENNITDTQLIAMPDDEVIALLTQIKGVGKWTVEMLLMFTLGREDIFALDDLGLQNAVIKLYNLRTKDKKKLKERLQKISKQWSPYRTYASLHLWKWKDNAPPAATTKKVTTKTKKAIKVSK